MGNRPTMSMGRGRVISYPDDKEYPAPDDSSVETEIMLAIRDEDLSEIAEDDSDDDLQSDPDETATKSFTAVQGTRTGMVDVLRAGLPPRGKVGPAYRDENITFYSPTLLEVLLIGDAESIGFASLPEDQIGDLIAEIKRRNPDRMIIDTRKEETKIPKSIEEWNELSPICIIPQGHNAFRNVVGDDLAKVILNEGNGLVVFVKPASGIKTNQDVKPTAREERLVFDLYPDYTDIETAISILINRCSVQGIKAIRNPETIGNNNDLNILISVEIVRRLYEETIDEKLRSAKGRRLIKDAKLKIHERQRVEIERKFNRPVKDEEIRIDMDEVRQIALSEMIKDKDGDKTISDELRTRFTAMPEEDRKTLVRELYEIFTHTEHLAKGVALLLPSADAHADKRYRLIHGWEMLEYVENECLGRKQEIGIEKSVIEKGGSDLLERRETVEREQYIRTLQYLIMRSFEQMQSEKGEEKMELCMPHGRTTLKNAMDHLTANRAKGGILRRELSALSLHWARETLKEIEKLIDTNIAEDFFDMYEIPGHPQKAPKNSTLVDQDILDSPLTPAICIIKIAMHALERFNDFDTLEKEMYDRAGEMLNLVAELPPASIPPGLPVKLARLRRRYASGENERMAVIELDLYEHQTPYPQNDT